ncbi:putative structural protein [Agrobacterium phage OLIVR4]|nr:putative structural protein [Agrobacterium phage OLIVR4]
MLQGSRRRQGRQAWRHHRRTERQEPGSQGRERTGPLRTAHDRKY